ncbi:Hypothetical_protein [Hexamita inflata]|uniref:Hypothetical_protein n=1 Tax=Hexamita inflata TaxID=28002 RepID=A0ABP1HRH0_9EUKA
MVYFSTLFSPWSIIICFNQQIYLNYSYCKIQHALILNNQLSFAGGSFLIQQYSFYLSKIACFQLQPELSYKSCFQRGGSLDQTGLGAKMHFGEYHFTVIIDYIGIYKQEQQLIFSIFVSFYLATYLKSGHKSLLFSSQKFSINSLYCRCNFDYVICDVSTPNISNFYFSPLNNNSYSNTTSISAPISKNSSFIIPTQLASLSSDVLQISIGFSQPSPRVRNQKPQPSPIKNQNYVALQSKVKHFALDCELSTSFSIEPEDVFDLKMENLRLQTRELKERILSLEKIAGSYSERVADQILTLENLRRGLMVKKFVWEK